MDVTFYLKFSTFGLKVQVIKQCSTWSREINDQDIFDQTLAYLVNFVATTILPKPHSVSIFFIVNVDMFSVIDKWDILFCGGYMPRISGNAEILKSYGGIISANGMMSATIRNGVLFARPYTTIIHTLGELVMAYGDTDGFVRMMELSIMAGKSYY